MKFAELLSKSLDDGNGSTSAMRLVMVLGALAIFVVWTYVSLLNVRISEIPQSVIEVLLVLIAGKVAQAHVDNKTP